MRYERVRLLGRGATAETFLAKDWLRGERQVALKIFKKEWAAERPDLIDHEFRILASVAHPSIGSIEDFGEEEGVPYIVTELIEGETIEDHLKEADLNTAIWRFAELIEALDYLYFRNIVHLDLKPQNILVQKPSASHGARLKLIDFGLAALTTAKGTPQTEAIGTPPYTAPEFALRRAVDTRSDLYSVGVLFYRTLSGRSPFEGDDPVTILNQQLTRDPIPLKDLVDRIPPGLSAFVGRLLARDPSKRFENPRQAFAGLQEAIGETFSQAPVVPIPLFEEPDLLFRQKESLRLLHEIRTSGGRWAIEGGSGMGKTFLARWLERSFWKERRPVLSWNGERIVLADGKREVEEGDGVVIVDDADRGPVREWAEGLKNVVALGRRMEEFWKDGWRRLTLGPMDEDRMREMIESRFGGSAPVWSWIGRSQGIPGEFVRIGRELLQGNKKVVPPRKRLLEVLSSCQIALDQETLALWTGQSMGEVEDLIRELLEEGVLERSVQGGGALFQVRCDTLPSEELPVLKANEKQALSILQTLFDQGRYRDGLDLLRRVENPSTPLLLLMNAKLLTGAALYPEALMILTDDFIRRLLREKQAEGCETRGKGHLFLGEHSEALHFLKDACDRFRANGDTDGEIRALMHLGILLQRIGDSEGARNLYEKGLSLAPRARQADLLRGVLGLNLANLEYDRSNWDEADRTYRISIDHLSRSGHGPVLAQAVLNRANLVFYMGRLQESTHLCREALRIAVDHRYRLTQGRALLLLAMMDESRRDPERQRERLCEAVSIFEGAGLSFEEAQGLIQRAYFYEAIGKIDDAEADARWGLSKAEAAGAMDLVGQACLILGRILGRRGNMDEAGACLDRAQGHFSSGKNPQMRWECDFERGELERRRGDIPQARRFLEQALREIDEVVEGLSPLVQESFLRDRKRERVLRAIEEVKGQR